VDYFALQLKLLAFFEYRVFPVTSIVQDSQAKGSAADHLQNIICGLFVENQIHVFLSVAMTLIICYSRIYLAYHFPFDIVLGLATGLCSVGISLLLVKGTIKLWNRRKESHK
jgi:membrane-associated phospholipid phosphatase